MGLREISQTMPAHSLGSPHIWSMARVDQMRSEGSLSQLLRRRGEDCSPLCLSLALWTKMLEHRTSHIKPQQGKVSLETGRTPLFLFIQSAEILTMYQALCSGQTTRLERTYGLPGHRMKTLGRWAACVWEGSGVVPGCGIY